MVVSSPMRIDATGRSHVSTNRLIAWSIGFGFVLFVAISMVAASGTPDPTEAVAPSMTTSIVNSAVIVFREGLEAVLIFAAVTASFLGTRQRFRRPVVLGVGAALAATVVTWFVMQAVVGALSVYGDVLLAVTGLIAVVVLLVVMNWFFHKVYWTDHISGLNKKKRALVDESEQAGEMRFWGFVALGFTSVYREGFEVVLFLQNLQLRSGTTAVLWGVLLGLIGTVIVGWLTFVAHHRLPYKRMLVLTGVLLGAVLVVMVGGSARTMQDLGWIPTTPLGVGFPDWWARWLEIVPTVETLTIQVLAALFVIGSYYAAEWWASEKRRRRSHGQAQVHRQSDTSSAVRAPVQSAVAVQAPPQPSSCVRLDLPRLSLLDTSTVAQRTVRHGAPPDSASAALPALLAARLPDRRANQHSLPVALNLPRLVLTSDLRPSAPATDRTTNIGTEVGQ